MKMKKHTSFTSMLQKGTKFFMTYLSLCIIIALQACGSDDKNGDSPVTGIGNVQGNIINDHNNQGIAEVRISIAGLDRIVTSDYSGSYFIDNLPVGEYTLEFSKLGFGSITKSVVVKPFQTTTCDIIMRQAANVEISKWTSTGCETTIKFKPCEAVKSYRYYIGTDIDNGKMIEGPVEVNLTITELEFGKEYSVTAIAYDHYGKEGETSTFKFKADSFENESWVAFSQNNTIVIEDGICANVKCYIRATGTNLHFKKAYYLCLEKSKVPASIDELASRIIYDGITNTTQSEPIELYFSNLKPGTEYTMFLLGQANRIYGTGYNQYSFALEEYNFRTEVLNNAYAGIQIIDKFNSSATYSANRVGNCLRFIIKKGIDCPELLDQPNIIKAAVCHTTATTDYAYIPNTTEYFQSNSVCALFTLGYSNPSASSEVRGGFRQEVLCFGSAVYPPKSARSTLSGKASGEVVGGFCNIKELSTEL